MTHMYAMSQEMLGESQISQQRLPARPGRLRMCQKSGMSYKSRRSGKHYNLYGRCPESCRLASVPDCPRLSPIVPDCPRIQPHNMCRYVTSGGCANTGEGQMLEGEA